MADEKRMIQDYEVIHAIRFGGGEVILAENIADVNPYMVCDCSSNNPINLEVYSNGIVSADFLEVMREFTKRLTERIELLETERSQCGIPMQPLTVNDCEHGGKESDMTGRVVVIKPEKLAPEYRSPAYQLQLCTGGFGARPNARGRAVYCTELFSGDQARFDRDSVAGTISPERLPDWAKEKLAALQKPKDREQTAEQAQTSENHQGDTFSIYQLKSGDSTRELRFEPLDRLAAAGLEVNPVNYELVYSAPITSDTENLDKIFAKFNNNHPEDYKGRSLSVSDVIIINDGGHQIAHYIDSFGFKEMPEFLQASDAQPDIEKSDTSRKPAKESVLDKIKESRENQEPRKSTAKKHDKDGQEL